MTDLNKERVLFYDWHFKNWHKNAGGMDLEAAQNLYRRIFSHNHTMIEREKEFDAWCGAKSQSLSKQTIDEIQSWIAVNSFSVEDAHPNLPIIDANELASFIDQLVRGQLENCVSGYKYHIQPVEHEPKL